VACRQELAVRLAGVAPNGLALSARAYAAAGRNYAVAAVEFGGSTAGLFGWVVVGGSF
jgi:hypothetical protein